MNPQLFKVRKFKKMMSGFYVKVRDKDKNRWGRPVVVC